MIATGAIAARRLLLAIAGWQCALGIGISIILWAVFSGHSAWSALAGGVVAGAGSASMALVVGTVRPDAPPKRLLVGFMIGEVLKLVVTLILFVAVIVFLDVSPLAMLGTFAAAFVVYWLVLITATSKLGQ